MLAKIAGLASPAGIASLAAAALAMLAATPAHAAGGFPRAARQPDMANCTSVIVDAERRFAVPPKLLQTIGLVESGRNDPATGRLAPWPWTINAAGVPHVFATKQAAIDAVSELQKAGIQSIDVGCMQINLMHHPEAFVSLDEAFDPSANTRFGARFLMALHRETSNWPQAVAAYHSRTPDIGVPYETRVMAMWPLGAEYRDAMPQRGSSAAAAQAGDSAYTPELSARVAQLRVDFARAAALSGPIDPRLRGANDGH